MQQEDERRLYITAMRLNPEDHRLALAVAEAHGLPISSTMRMLIRREARALGLDATAAKPTRKAAR